MPAKVKLNANAAEKPAPKRRRRARSSSDEDDTTTSSSSSSSDSASSDASNSENDSSSAASSDAEGARPRTARGRGGGGRGGARGGRGATGARRGANASEGEDTDNPSTTAASPKVTTSSKSKKKPRRGTSDSDEERDDNDDDSGTKKGAGRRREAAAPRSKRTKAKEEDAESDEDSDENGTAATAAGRKKRATKSSAAAEGISRLDGGANGVAFDIVPFPHPMTYLGPLIRHAHPSNPAAGPRLMPLVKPYRGLGASASNAFTSAPTKINLPPPSAPSASFSGNNNDTAPLESGGGVSSALSEGGRSSAILPPPPLLPFVDVLDASPVAAPVVGCVAALYIATIQHQNSTDTAIKAALSAATASSSAASPSSSPPPASPAPSTKGKMKPEAVVRSANATATLINTLRLISADSKAVESLEADEEEEKEEEKRKRKVAASGKSGVEDEASQSTESRDQKVSEGQEDEGQQDGDDECEKSKALARLKELLSAQIELLSDAKASKNASKAQVTLTSMMERLKRCLFLSYSTAGPPSQTVTVDPTVITPYSTAFQHASYGTGSGGGGVYLTAVPTLPGVTINSKTGLPHSPAGPQYSPAATHGLHCLFFDDYCEASEHLMRRHNGVVCGPAADASGYSEPASVTQAKEILRNVGVTDAPLVGGVNDGGGLGVGGSGDSGSGASKRARDGDGDGGGKEGRSSKKEGRSEQSAADRRKEREQREREKAKAAIMVTSNCPPSFTQHLAHYGVFPSKCQTTSIGHVATVLSGAVSPPQPGKTHVSPIGTLNAVIACDVKAAALTEDGRVVVVGLVPTGAAPPTTYSGAHQPLSALRLQRITGLSLPAGLLPTAIAVAPLTPQSATLDCQKSANDIPNLQSYTAANGNEARPAAEITTKMRQALDHLGSDAVKAADFYLRSTVDNFVQFKKEVLEPFGSGLAWGGGNVGAKAAKGLAAATAAALASAGAGGGGASNNAGQQIAFLPDIRVAVGTQHLKVFLCVCRVAYNPIVNVQTDADSIREVAAVAEQQRQREREREAKAKVAAPNASAASYARGGLAPLPFFKKKVLPASAASPSSSSSAAAVSGSSALKPRPLALRINRAAGQCLSPDRSEFFILKCFSPCNDGVVVTASLFNPISAMSFGLPADYRLRFYSALEESIDISYVGAGAGAPTKPALAGRTFPMYYLSSAACGRKGLPGFQVQQSTREAIDAVLDSYLVRDVVRHSGSDGGLLAAVGAHGNFSPQALSCETTANSSILTSFNTPSFISLPTEPIDSYAAAALRTNTFDVSDPIRPLSHTASSNPMGGTGSPARSKASASLGGGREAKCFSTSNTAHFATPFAPTQPLLVSSQGPQPHDWACDAGVGSGSRFGNSNLLMSQSASPALGVFPCALSSSRTDPSTFYGSSSVNMVGERSLNSFLSADLYPLADSESSAAGPTASFVSTSAVAPMMFESDALASAIPTHEVMAGGNGVTALTPCGTTARVLSQLRVKDVFAGSFTSGLREGDTAAGCVQMCGQLRDLLRGDSGIGGDGLQNSSGGLDAITSPSSSSLGGGGFNPFAVAKKEKNSQKDNANDSASQGPLPFVQVFTFTKNFPQIVIPLDTFAFFRSKLSSYSYFSASGGNSPTTNLPQSHTLTGPDGASATGNMTINNVFSATATRSFQSAAAVPIDPIASPAIISSDALALRWMPRATSGYIVSETAEKIAAAAGSNASSSRTVLLRTLEGVLEKEPVLLPELLAIMRRNQMVMVAFK